MLCRYLVLYFLLLIPFCEAVSQASAPKYSNEFLTLGVGARYLGMGGTAVATTGDATAGYWNPAGLMAIEPRHQLMLMHNAYFAGIANYDYGTFTTRLDTSSRLALSVIRFAVDNIPDTRFLFDANGSINYDNIRMFSAADYGFLLSYARRLQFLGGVRFGGSVKVIHRIAGQFATSWGFGLDVGLQKSLGNWNFGLAGKDILGTFNAWSHNPDELREIYAITNNEVPVSSIEVTLPRLVPGVSYTFEISQFSILPALDLEMTFDGKRNTLIKSTFVSIDPRAGLEVGFKKIAFLRLGIQQFQQVGDLDNELSWTSMPTAGLGFAIGDLSIDYALTDLGDQAAGLYSHVFSIKVDFHEKGQ